MKEININSLPITNEQWAFIMKVRDDLNMTTNEIMVLFDTGRNQRNDI